MTPLIISAIFNCTVVWGIFDFLREEVVPPCSTACFTFVEVAGVAVGGKDHVAFAVG